MVLAVGAVAGTPAEKAADLQGPAFGMPADEATEPEKATESDGVAQTEKSAQPEKSSESKNETDAVAPEKKADAKPVEKKAATAKAEKKVDAAAAEKTDVVGEPLAPGMVKLLQEEILAGIRRRGITDRFARFQSYAAGRLYATAGKYTGSELTGNCRLHWYDHLLRNVLAAPAEAEQFTRELHTAALNSHDGLAQVLAIAAEKMDAGRRKPRTFASPTSPEQAIDVIEQALTDAQVSYCAAMAPLEQVGDSRTAILSGARALDAESGGAHGGRPRHGPPALRSDGKDGSGRSVHGRRGTGPDRRRPTVGTTQVAARPTGNVKVPGVTGTVVARSTRPAARSSSAAREDNTYQLDQMRDVAVVIDLGGNDAYYEGTVGTDRPVLVVIDLAGNDLYRGSRPGIQGAAVLGISMLLDLAGDDVYQAQDVAQGSALAGVGILIDYAGNDRYRGIRRVQGNAIGGLGILVDRAGKDDYHAAMWAQGVGGPLGFALLDDISGNDHYYCGGMWRNSYYPETPGYEGWGQGVGGGIRQVGRRRHWRDPRRRRRRRL